MAQSWQRSDEYLHLPFGITLPSLPELVLLLGTATLAVAALVFAVASVVPWVRRPVLHALVTLWPLFIPLELITFTAFTFGLLSALAPLPADQWWAQALSEIGVAMAYFIPFRFLCGMHRGFGHSYPRSTPSEVRRSGGRSETTRPDSSSAYSAGSPSVDHK